MLLIVLGSIIIGLGVFWLVAVEQRIFKLGSKIALLGLVLVIYGKNTEASKIRTVHCGLEKKTEEQYMANPNRFYPAVCKIEY